MMPMVDEKSLYKAFRRFMWLLRNGSSTTELPLFAPEIFFRSFWAGKPVSDFQADKQQDSQEFLNALLQAMPEEMGRVFNGVMLQTLKCLECNQSRVKNDHFVVLTLEIQGLGKNQTLKGAFDKHTAEELIEEKNQLIECLDCSAKLSDGTIVRTPHARNSTISLAPAVIAIHLKRFLTSPSVGHSCPTLCTTRAPPPLEW
jgi:ubiquitin C-terminal hydrolase